MAEKLLHLIHTTCRVKPARSLPKMGGKKSKFKPAQLTNLYSSEEKYEEASKSEANLFAADAKIDIDHFELLGTLGEGTFGKVRLARHKSLKEKAFAIKILDKRMIIDNSQIPHLRNEKSILEDFVHPFIVNLRATFQDSAHVFMVLNYVAGGEMFKYLRDDGQFSIAQTRFYAGEIFLALEFLHRKDIIYRDLKPENLLITRSGHVIVTDFGFAKKIGNSKTYTTCGTPDYLAPEIIKSRGHGKPVDWWALGVLIFEMATGFPPFYDDNQVQMYKNIMAGRFSGFPADVAKNKHIVRIVKDFLQVDITKRLGKYQSLRLFPRNLFLAVSPRRGEWTLPFSNCSSCPMSNLILSPYAHFAPPLAKAV